MDNLTIKPDVIKDVDSSRLDSYLEFARSNCVPGGGFNVEQALEMLFKCEGNVLEATRKLIHNDLNFPVWSREEHAEFVRLIEEVHGKNFYLISKDLKTKSVKECVEYYYLWKKSHTRTLTRNNRNLSNPSNNNNNSSSNNNNNNSNTTTKIINNNTLNNNDTSLGKNGAIKLEVPQIAPTDIFPCKVCGRIFEKIKSRSAHMKRHKNEVSNFGYAYDH